MSKLEFTNKYNNLVTKLEPNEFSFKIGHTEYKDGELDYYLEDIDGKKALSLEVSALDEDNKECSLSFMLNMNIDDLNKLKKEPICINDKILPNDTYFYDERKDRKVNIDNDFEFSMVELKPSYYVQKLDTDKFVFRIFIPSKLLFTYFLCDLTKKN